MTAGQLPHEADVHARMMVRALALAETAAHLGEVPVGAVVYDASGAILGEGHNTVLRDHDPSAHAEVNALRAAGAAIASHRLDEMYLAVSLEPCAMCAQAISHARIKELRFGAYDVKSGGTVHGARVYDYATCHHKPQVYGGFMEEASVALLQGFFQERRLLES